MDKNIKVSESIYKRLVEDKKDFSEKIGLKFSFNATIKELYKIIDSFMSNKK